MTQTLTGQRDRSHRRTGAGEWNADAPRRPRKSPKPGKVPSPVRSDGMSTVRARQVSLPATDRGVDAHVGGQASDLHVATARLVVLPATDPAPAP
ncbi:hypothetical protein Aglo03_66210 [Actinokineospora globicatena]|uniref:Uncharacterized protein n=1 Tax=Actinokineospora globicatena TaxID=103729 RepID=A0A9W6QT82_9PSEU|nr:hypothetical protein Aglo03_66210 [Actinokineospora globicatena]